ncbi:hypothetical protein [Chroococcidiopsis sp. CCMEE 29]|nr:hypothetical protein [Chroococcidiopsis sp. CCMEE 29]
MSSLSEAAENLYIVISPGVFKQAAAEAYLKAIGEEEEEEEKS